LNSHSSQEGNSILKRNFVKVRHVPQQTGNNQNGQPNPSQTYLSALSVGGGVRGRDQQQKQPQTVLGLEVSVCVCILLSF